MVMVVMMVPLGLLDLGEGLLGSREVAALQGGGEGTHGVLGGTPLPGGGGGSLDLGGGALGCIGLEGGKGLLGACEVAALQGLAELVPEILRLGPLGLRVRTYRTGGRRDTKV